MIYTLALTGSVGSGKTVVTEYLTKYGITIIDADTICREILEENKDVIDQIISFFGLSILDNNGNIDRSKIRQKVFTNKKNKLWLEQLLHPIIRETINNKQQKITGDYCVIVIPLLNSKNVKHYHFDKLCLVKSTKELQINRIMMRDKVDTNNANAMLNSQNENQQESLKVDYYIDNKQDIENLYHECDILHKKISQCSKEEKK